MILNSLNKNQRMEVNLFCVIDSHPVTAESKRSFDSNEFKCSLHLISRNSDSKKDLL